VVAETWIEAPVNLQEEVGMISTQDLLGATHRREFTVFDVALDDIHPLNFVEQEVSVSISTSIAPGPALPVSAKSFADHAAAMGLGTDSARSDGHPVGDPVSFEVGFEQRPVHRGRIEQVDLDVGVG